MRINAALLATAYPAQANGRAQLLPAGEFAARDGRPGPGLRWKLSNKGGQALAAQLNAVAGLTPISIDYEHQTLLAATNGQPAPAAGWIERVEWSAATGLHAQVKWTPRGRALIEADEYRYISPVILYDEQNNVTGLHNAALVSVPAIVGMDAVSAALAALFPNPTPNPQLEPAVDLLTLTVLLGMAAGATAQDVTAQITALGKLLPQMAQALGLPAAATQADVNARITALAARPALPAQLVAALGLQATADEAAALAALHRLQQPDGATVANVTALQRQVAALTAQIVLDQVTRTVDEAVAAHKLLPAQRDWALGLGKADMAQLSAYLKTAPTIPGLGGQTGGEGRDAAAGDGADPLAISRKAVAYQTAQLSAGVNVSTQQAVAAVMAAAAAAAAA